MHHIFIDNRIGIDNIPNNKDIKRFIYSIIFSNQISIDENKDIHLFLFAHVI